MNLYIKHIVEAFDFNSVNNQKKTINVYDIILPEILEKLDILDSDNEITEEEYNILKTRNNIYTVQSKAKLIALIDYFVNKFGNECVLNWMDISNITDLSLLFYNSEFNGDISAWNVSNVTKMDSMFNTSSFNGDISNWNVSNVTDMSLMFAYSDFDNDISNWNINPKCKVRDMFDYSSIRDEYKPKCLKLNEAFDFDSVNKEKKSINANDILQGIFNKLDKWEEPTKDEVDVWYIVER